MELVPCTYRALAARGVLAGRVVRRRGRRHVDAHSVVSGVVAVGPAAARDEARKKFRKG